MAEQTESQGGSGERYSALDGTSSSAMLKSTISQAFEVRDL